MAEELIIRMRLMHDDEFAFMCLLKLYELQEEDEQNGHTTHHVNGVGFNKTDAPVLSSYVEAFQNGFDFHPEHYAKMHELLPKYAKQLSRYLTDEEVEI